MLLSAVGKSIKEERKKSRDGCGRRENYGGSFFPLQAVTPSKILGRGDEEHLRDELQEELISSSLGGRKEEEAGRKVEIMKSEEETGTKEEETGTKEEETGIKEEETGRKREEIWIRETDVMAATEKTQESSENEIPLKKLSQSQKRRQRRKRLQARLFAKLQEQNMEQAQKVKPNSNEKISAAEPDDDDDDGVSLYGMIRPC